MKIKVNFCWYVVFFLFGLMSIYQPLYALMGNELNHGEPSNALFTAKTEINLIIHSSGTFDFNDGTVQVRRVGLIPPKQ